MKKFLAIIVAALMTVMLLPLTACVKPDDDANKVEYTVAVKSLGGDKLRNVTVNLLDGATKTTTGQTGTNGEVKLKAEPKEYEVTVENIPHGYEAPTETYKTDTSGEKTVNIFLNSGVIVGEQMPTGYLYSIGDVMYDFTVQTSTGKTFNLAEALKDKKAVLINFWANWCGPCVNEFPAMAEAYEEYKDDLAIIALAPFNTQANGVNYATNLGIEIFKEENPSVNFDMALDTGATIANCFNVGSIPRSIIIDRFGVYAWDQEGSIDSKAEWKLHFDRFTSENYSQIISRPDDPVDVKPRPKPDVDPQESSLLEAAINRNGFNGTYSPETETDDKEYSWPWLVGEENGVKYIYASNKGKQENSFATVHVDFSVKKDQVVAFDYFLSTEPGSEIGGDYLYIILDNNYSDYVRLSGVTDGWETHYLFTAVEDGEHHLVLLYNTDDANADGDPYTDDVRISNMRYMTTQEVVNNGGSFDTRYYCATNWDDKKSGWQNYVSVGFNPNDGYYHLLDGNGQPNGPYVLAEMNNANTHWSNASLYDYAANEYCIYEDDNGDVIDDTKLIIQYCSYANNSTVFGFVPVTQELYEALTRLAKYCGQAEDANNENQWLEMCSYYIHYGVGTGPADKDPLKGVTPFSAYDLHVGTNQIVIDRLTYPRGIYYKFVPETSAVYEFKSSASIKDDNDIPTCWVVDEKGNIISDENEDGDNFTLYLELTAGKTYYALCDMYFPNVDGKTFTWPLTITNMGSSYTTLRSVTHGFYTFDEYYYDTYGSYINTIALHDNIDAGQDMNGNWVVRDKKGNKIDNVYIDFFGDSYLLGDITIAGILAQEGKPDSQKNLKFYLSDNSGSAIFDEDGKQLWDYLSFDLTKYGFGNYVDSMKKYLEEANANDGLVKVDATLAKILDEFAQVISDMREDSSKGTHVKNEWLMMCCYNHTYKV